MLYYIMHGFSTLTAIPYHPYSTFCPKPVRPCFIPIKITGK